jgi:hypothetical protein
MKKETSDGIRAVILRLGVMMLYVPAHALFTLEWLIEGESRAKRGMKYFIRHGKFIGSGGD